MLENKIAILKEVYDLAKNRRLEYEQNNKDEGIVDLMSINPEGLSMSKEERVLDNYLNSLDFEDVKMIQTIMYLGRDKDYNTSSSPEVIYKESREYMDNLGWGEKHIEVDQMVQKLPLDIYLESGYKILNLTI